MDEFVQQVLKDQNAADEQISDLRAEVDRLHRYIRRQWAAVAAAESAGAQASGRPADALVSPAAQARSVLSQAQEIADRRLAQADARLNDAERLAADRLAEADRQAEARLADADQRASRAIAAGADEAAQRLTRVDAIAEQVLISARQDAAGRRARAADEADRMLLQARSQYENIVVRAHRCADRAAEVALAEIQHPTTADDGGRVRAELEMKAAYLRTFAKVSRAALRAALDVTAREFDRLLGASAARESAPASQIAHGPIPYGPIPIDPALVLAPAGPPPPVRPSNPATRAASRAQPRVIVLPDTDAAELATVIRLP